MSIECQILKDKYQIILLIALITCSMQSQIIDTDTSDVVIRKTKKETPQEFNISDVVIKTDKEKTKNTMRVDLDLPVSTQLKLNVSDSAGTNIMYLIIVQSFKPGVYRVKWEMARCIGEINEYCYAPGKYLCVFETNHFVYQKDFYIK